MITHKASPQQLLEQYKKAVDFSMIVSKTDSTGAITYVNDQFADISKYTKEELIGKNHNIIRHPDSPVSLFKELWATIRTKKIWKGIVKNLAKDGSYYYVDTVIIPIVDDDGEIIEYIGLRNDITRLLETQKLLEQAKVDEVTNLKSRTALLEDTGFQTDNSLALIDIVNFKHINDFYGHLIGDKLLKVIGDELQMFTEGFDCHLYRLPIDLFAILTQESVESLEKIVEEFSKHIASKPIAISNSQIYINIVSGLAGCENKERIYQYADVALQYAKTNKKNIQRYSTEINLQREIKSNLLWTQRLNEAIFDNKLRTFYQPIVDNKTMEYKKYESLVRLIDENDNIVSPFYFLNISKQTKLYSYLTQKILEDSIKRFKDNKLDFSVNLSIEDFENEKTVAMLFEVFKDRQIARQATLEITETEEINNYETVIQVISKLKKLGCKIAIDDFGSGYSNFTYLMKLKADYIKIDGSLIEKIDYDPSSQSIVKAIVSFAQEMGIKTVAEYVSSEAIFNKVIQLQIDYSQGSYFGMPKEDI
jgi:diguanylate cyclase (GGDEF)-like protein/PAS domain S-box-containing protein